MATKLEDPQDKFQQRENQRFGLHKSKEQLKDAAGKSSKKGGSSSSGGKSGLGQREAAAAKGQAHDKGLYRGAPKAGGKGRKKMSFRKKTGLGTAGIITSLIVFMAPLITGPLQFIHLGQVLMTDFAGLNEMGDSRTSKLYRYMRWNGDNIEKRRLGIIGNRVANTIEKKLKVNGIEIQKNNRGFMSGITVDGKTIDMVDADGNPTKNRARRKQLTATLRSKGYGAIAASLMSRPLFYRYGIDLRLFGNKTRNISESYGERRKRVSDEAEARIKDSSIEGGFRPVDLEEIDSDIAELESSGGSQEDLDDLRATRDVIATELASIDDGILEIQADVDAHTAAGDRHPYRAAAKDLAGRFKGKGLIAGAVGMGVCFTRSIGQTALKLEFASKYLPLARSGMEAVTIGQQLQSGEYVDAADLGILSERFTDEGASWAAAAGINYKTSGEYTGVEPAISTNIGEAEQHSVVKASEFLDLGVINLVCGALQNTIVQGGLLLAEGALCIVSLGFSCGVAAVAEEVIYEGFSRLLLSPYGASLIKAAVGDSVDPMASGPEYGNNVASGSYFAASEASRDAGAYSLSKQETAELITYTGNIQSEQYASRSLVDRLFNTRDSTSLVGRLFTDTPKEPLSIASLVNPASFVANSMLKNLETTSTTDVYAAEEGADVNYLYSGVPKIAFSVAEIESELAEDPFENERYIHDEMTEDYFTDFEGLQQIFEFCSVPLPSPSDDVEPGYYLARNPCEEENFAFFIQRLNVFTYSTTSSGDTSNNTDSSTNNVLAANTSRQSFNDFIRNLDTRSSAFQDDLYKYRMYNLDTNLLLAQGCNAGDEQSCTELGVGNFSFGNIPEGLECPSNLGAPNPSRNNYYLLPEAPNGEYNKRASDANSYGTLQMICAIYTAGKKFEASPYGSLATLQVTDLNNQPNHSTHRWGIAVDVHGSGPETCVANHYTSGCSSRYNNEATTVLGQAFVSTGVVDNIWWCEPGAAGGASSGNTGSMDAIRAYGDSIGKPVNISCVWDNDLGNNGHRDHFHVDISCEFKGVDEKGGPKSNPSATCHN